MKSQFEARLGAVRGVGLALVCCVSTMTLLSACAVSPNADPSDAQSEPLPQDANTLLVGAELALQRQQYRDAAELFAAALDASDDEALAERATRVAYQYHQYRAVLRMTQRWLAINPTSEDARRFAGFAALRLYRINVAADHFGSLIETGFISPQAGFVTLLPQWLDEGSRPATMALMQRLLPKHDSTAEAHYALGQAAFQSENNALALQGAQRAAELSPYWMPAKWLLARVHLVSGNAEEALRIARSIVEQENKPEFRLELAQLMYATGETEEAMRALEALSAEPEIADAAARSIALLQLQGGDLDSAYRAFRDLVKGGRFIYESMFYLGQIAEIKEQTSDAIELYTRVTAGDLAVSAQTRAARLTAEGGTTADGLAVLQKFAKEHPAFALDVTMAQSSLLAEWGDSKQALKLLDDALLEYPDHDDLRVAKALALERMQRSSQALVLMRELVRDRPDDPSALNMLGYTLVDRTRNLDEGLAMIERALSMLPDNGAVLDSMGWALHKKGRDADALPYLERALRHARDAEIAVHLGDVQWSQGQREAARETWQKALEEFPDNAALKERVEKRKSK
jgi:tetratricopeptide (TPR) repeat protein